MALHRLAFVVLLFAPAVGRIRTPDLDALLELFKFMGGMHWDRNEGWDPEGQTDPCNFDEHWFGVGCIDPCDIYRDGPACAFGRITALNLRDNNLTDGGKDGTDFSAERWQWSALQVMLYGGPSCYPSLLRGLPLATDGLERHDAARWRSPPGR